MKRKEFLAEILWMVAYAGRYWKSIAFYMVSGVFGVLMSLGASLVSKQLLDVVICGSRGKIGYYALWMILMALAGILSDGIISYISARIGVKVQNEIQADIYEKVVTSEWEDLQKYRSGDLLNRLNSDAQQVAGSVISWLPDAVTKLVHFLGAFLIIFYYDPIMAAIALLSAPVTLLLSRTLMRKMRRYNKQMREYTSVLMAFQNDTFGGLQTVKALGLEKLFGCRLKLMQEQYKEKILEYNQFTIYTSTLMSTVGMAVSYICFGWSVYRLWTGYITAGTLVMFLQMASSLSSSFSSLVQTVPSAINAATCAGRLMEISDLKKEEVKDEKQAAHLKKEKKDGISLCLKRVDLSYQEGKQVIHQADLFAKAGEITALIGPSGEGKTTLLRLMLGLLHETSGEAWMEGADGTRCALSPASRELISYVPQGNTIFAGTIEENLKMVKADATEEELWESLRLGCAREFVEALPDGIHTYVGENGTGLSEGQAQRLAIARALLKDAPILILDEATSALDLETEANVLDHILHQNRMRTCIVTTHRESILPMSHHIYRITERRVEKLK